jgi:hypothetical protein
MLFKYYEYQACVQPIFIILSKVIRIKKTKCKELTNLFTIDKFTEILRKIIRIHDCNSAIMSNLFLCISTLAEATDISLITNILSIQRLKEIFKIFKMSGFDIIHDTIFSIIKLIITKRSEKSKNVKKQMNTETLIINTEATTPTDMSDEDYQDVIIIFSNLLFFIRNKIHMLDFFKLTKWLNSFLTHMYTVSHMINNFPAEILKKFSNVLLEKKIVEFMIDCFNFIADKKVFSGLDTAFQALDPNLLKIKITIFRATHHCLSLIKNLKDLNSSNLVRNKK